MTIVANGLCVLYFQKNSPWKESRLVEFQVAKVIVSVNHLYANILVLYFSGLSFFSSL